MPTPDSIFISSTHEGDFFDTWRVGMSLTEGDFFPINGGDFYLVYRDRNNSQYDYSKPVARMAEDDTSVGISDMELEPEAGRNIWHFTRKAVSKYGVLSADADDCLVTVDSDAVMVLPSGNDPRGVSAQPIKDGGIRLRWSYSSQGEDAVPTGFKVYRETDIDYVRITGTLSPDITGDFLNIGPQAAFGFYDPAAPDSDVYSVDIDGTTWYHWHDSIGGTVNWFITTVIGNIGVDLWRWGKEYVAGNRGGDYTASGNSTGTATVTEAKDNWTFESDINFNGGRNYELDISGLTHDVDYKFTVRTYRTVAAVDYETVNEIIVEARADDTGPAALTSIAVVVE